MIRKITFGCLWYCSLSLSVVQAQQYRSFSPGIEANPYLNPGYAERLPLNAKLPFWMTFHGRYRSLPQLPDGPATMFVSGDVYGRPGKANATLIGGLQFLQFNTDPIITTQIKTRVAVAIPLRGKTWLSAGVSPGILQYTFRTERLLPVFPDDPLLAEGLQVCRDYSMGAGLYLISSWPWKRDKAKYQYWFLGASMPQINLRGIATQTNWQASHYYGYLGGRTELGSNDHFFLEPLVALRYVKNVPLQMEGVLRLKYTKDPSRTFDTFWAGAGWAGSRQKIAEMYYVEIGGGVPLYDRPFCFRVSYSFSSRSHISAFNSALEFSFSFVPFKDE